MMDWPEVDEEELEAALKLQDLVESERQMKDKSPPETPPIVSSTHTECNGFDHNLGQNWIYPSNFPLRAYQQNIVQAALYKNTLVVLPTGLGKTFIAAVVMYNFYRWYPNGKIIFMAPTRPLVSQQIAACQKIMPFTDKDTVEVTGRLARPKRIELWTSKRVFFATPQVVHSDMLDQSDQSGGGFPFDSVKLLVVDEAHRAKGRYAYTQVTESLMAHNHQFRMLALSATPGRTMDDVAAVCSNLYISNLAVRWENSIDVQPYIHKRTIRTIVVSLKDRIKGPRERLLQIIEPYLRQLIQSEVLKGARGNITKNNLIYDQKAFLERSSVQGQRHPDHNIIAGNFAMCISLYHALELLERHGLRVFVNNFDVDEDGREKYVITKDSALRNLVDELRNNLGANPLDLSTKPMTNGQMVPIPSELDFGHPKYEEVRKVLINHFQSHDDSRAIVFCEYRESVMLIQRLLCQHRPLLRARCFVGQGGANNSFYALTQKQQLAIMGDFRSGISNILVATSIGEEGLDVGEVELIICFDICSSNPTRFIQRIGRTGRKKNGEVVMLATEGREHQMLKDVLANKEQTNRQMLNSTVVMRSLYEQNPRMIPHQLQPKCEKQFIMQAEPKPQIQASTTEAKKRKVVTKVKSADLRKFFPQTPPSQEAILIGEQPYEISEKSQRLIQDEMSRSRIRVRNFLFETQTAAEPKISNSQEEIQRLRKLNRILQSAKPMISESQRNQDLYGQLQDKQLPQSLKFFLLQTNPQFVNDIRTKMQMQNEMELPKERLNGRQQKTRKNYELLMDICQGDLEQLLPSDNLSAELTIKDLPSSVDEQNEQEFQEACDQIFEGLPEQGLMADNYELRQELMDKLELHNLEVTVKEQLGKEETSWLDGEDDIKDEEETTAEQSFEMPMESIYNGQWQDFNDEDKPPHRSTPLRPKTKPIIEEPDVSRVEASDLSINLDRLNGLISGPIVDPINTEAVQITPDDLELELNEPRNLSTNLDGPINGPTIDPIKTEAVQITPNDLELDLNDFLEPMPEEQILMTQHQKQKQENNILDPLPTHKIELDLNDFLEPMAEEQILMSEHQRQKQESSPTPSLKENQQPSTSVQRSISPDLFADDSQSPCKPPQMKSLTAKLAAKTQKLATAPVLTSPEHRRCTNTINQEKSPSIFDLYLQRMRGRGPRLAKTAGLLHKQTTNLPNKEPEDSPIIQRRQSKRKIIISSDEDEDNEKQQRDVKNESVAQTQVIVDQIPATQIPITPTSKPRYKRRKRNSFILDEVELSGSDHDEEDAAEVTIGGYIKNSVIISSDEEDNHNDTNLHAMYLQAVRSPLQRPGAFKMPAQRVYHDASYIYSQPVEEPSQYMPCSFIVDEAEDDSLSNVTHDISECPLERAERILKEQRKERKLQRLNGGKLSGPSRATVLQPPRVKRRRIETYDLNSSSSNDEQ